MIEQYIRGIIEREEAIEESERPLYHTNCAENLLRSSNEQYDLGLDEKYFRLICPYGAGMQTGNTCGALLGSLAALGLLYGENKPTENKKMKAAVGAYVQRFEEHFGSLKCTCIKEKHCDETGSCTPVKVQAGELLEGVVRDFEAIYQEYLENEDAE
ncbi:MAG: C-GCAxxG-C-C family protein [Lachnospiraceae bacterium]|nr:C-GCAxxG-C-C family protein [Lachnospiraceae bacterium]